MKRKWFFLVLMAGLLGSLLLVTSCDTGGGGGMPNVDPLNNDLLVGIWMSNDGDERWTFLADDSFVNEMGSGGTWSVFMSGTYAFDNSAHLLALTSGSTIVMNLLLNAAENRMVQAVDALLGGNTTTLQGTWKGALWLPAGTQTHTWTISGTNITLHEVITGPFPIDETASGTFALLSGSTFSVSGSSDASFNGSYNYQVVGDGVTFSDNPGENLEYFDKLP